MRSIPFLWEASALVVDKGKHITFGKKKDKPAEERDLHLFRSWCTPSAWSREMLGGDLNWMNECIRGREEGRKDAWTSGFGSQSTLFMARVMAFLGHWWCWASVCAVATLTRASGRFLLCLQMLLLPGGIWPFPGSPVWRALGRIFPPLVLRVHLLFAPQLSCLRLQ